MLTTLPPLFCESICFTANCVVLASLTARYLVVDERTSQSIYSIPNHLANADPLIRQFERWARGRLAEGFSLDQAAKALATSKRTLARRMQSVLGKSPRRRSPSSRTCG
jgi:transcriptional regulator GlxA family with amidase domain